MPTLDVATATPPYWRRFAERAAASAGDLPADRPVVVVVHSAAGLLAPALRDAMPGRAVGAYLFVDAALPRGGATLVDEIPADAGVTAEMLRDVARDGLLPPWGADWPDGLWATLIPDPTTRARFAAEVPPVPLALYEEAPPPAPAWPDAPCAYLRFSTLYAAAEQRARRADWPTWLLPGEHLHMLADPDAVADALVDLANAVRDASVPPRPA